MIIWMMMFWTVCMQNYIAMHNLNCAIQISLSQITQGNCPINALTSKLWFWGGRAQWPSNHFRLYTTRCICTEAQQTRAPCTFDWHGTRTRATHLLPLWNAKPQIWSLVCTLWNSNIAITSLMCTLRNSNCTLCSRVKTVLYPFHIKPIMRSQRRFENNAVWCERSEAALFDTGVRKGAFYVGGLLLPREVFWKRILAKSRSLRWFGCQCERVHRIMRRERPNNALGWWCPSALSCSVF